MKRDHSSFLIDWINSNTRKPLVIRGARQVGKTWLIRDLAESMQSRLIELNFEKRPDFESLFSSNEPKEIIANIAESQGAIDPSNTILFLDEIQAAPPSPCKTALVCRRNAGTGSCGCWLPARLCFDRSRV
jgi:predicted AAA+ superfamily ATPase